MPSIPDDHERVLDAIDECHETLKQVHQQLIVLVKAMTDAVKALRTEDEGAEAGE